MHNDDNPDYHDDDISSSNDHDNNNDYNHDGGAAPSARPSLGFKYRSTPRIR